ncbi:ATP-binding cassette domain-containing protein, partial [Mammaliicoccus sciuri]
EVDGKLASSVHELSGGQKQRVAIAGVLVNDVDILLFDEPLASLDPATGKEVIDLIDRLQKQTKKTIVMVEHRLEDVLFRHV